MMITAVTAAQVRSCATLRTPWLLEQRSAAMASANALAVLREVFQLNEFRDQQWEAIEATLQGRDSIVLLPTGAGKAGGGWLQHAALAQARCARSCARPRAGGLLLPAWLLLLPACLPGANACLSTVPTRMHARTPARMHAEPMLSVAAAHVGGQVHRGRGPHHLPHEGAGVCGRAWCTHRATHAAHSALQRAPGWRHSCRQLHARPVLPRGSAHGSRAWQHVPE